MLELAVEAHVRQQIVGADQHQVDAFHATGDLDYARRFGWPVLRSVAEFATSRVTGSRRGFEIRDTVGPREHYDPVSNNAFTNMTAATMA
jgi:trehalose/maltose hydrolase-like predicted phosphorylase